MKYFLFVGKDLPLLSPVFLLNPTFYRITRQGRRLMLFPTNSTHKYSITNRLLYIVYYTSHIHIRILSIITEQIPYIEKKGCSLVRDLLHSLRSCYRLMLDISLPRVIRNCVMTMINIETYIHNLLVISCIHSFAATCSAYSLQSDPELNSLAYFIHDRCRFRYCERGLQQIPGSPAISTTSPALLLSL
jgi:hypothetical protein